MAKTRTLLAIAILLAAPAGGRAELLPPARQQSAAPGHLDSVVRVRDVQVGDTEIRGTLVNFTDDELRDIQLRVRDMFLWRNERRPGIDDVSRSEEFVLKGPVAPHGAIAFTAPRTPLPLRSDGDFNTSVEVTAVTVQPVSGQAQAPLGTPPPVGTQVAP